MDSGSHVKWKPSPGDTNPESPDFGNNGENPGFFAKALAVFGNKRKEGQSMAPRFPKFMKTQVNGRGVTALAPTHGKSNIWWCTTGPVMETKKLCGTSIDFPKIAPPTAAAQQKNLILEQTLKKTETVNADWPAKTDFVSERFAGVCANARNEAELTIKPVKDYTSHIHEFSNPVGLTSTMERTQIAGRWNNDLGHLRLDMQSFPDKLSTAEKPIPGLPSTRTNQVVLKLPSDPNNRSQIHPGCTRETLLNSRCTKLGK